MKINASWHSKHRMPKNPGWEERLAWHLEHAKNCACRRPTGKILQEIKKRGIQI